MEYRPRSCDLVIDPAAAAVLYDIRVCKEHGRMIGCHGIAFPGYAGPGVGRPVDYPETGIEPELRKLASGERRDKVFGVIGEFVKVEIDLVIGTVLVA